MKRSLVLLTAVFALVASASIPSENENRSDSNGRIVGGKLTDISKHPHQISMRYKSCTSCSYNHRCGGSIISKTIVITAAHCVHGIKDAKRIHVVAGSNTRNGNGVTMPVAKIVEHEKYSTNTAYGNDVAILVLGIEIPLNDYDIKTIKMADERPAHNDISQITGWGTTTEGGYPADLLLEVEVPIISNEFCELKYGSGKIDSSMLCAGSSKGGKDACQGDSGGPLVVKGVLAGVVSWGNGCARPEYPGVYASVADLRQWIDEAIKENS
ncbi:trypsin zeta-like [Episyrphus balteatus]|uniref:trypsin zeta-like n=1 Tax=Episyrphus balteatus TaxID=286459 RepID=UPI002485F775|nr:trypsin zeta-like [Episyrphus balteatus]